MLADAQGFTIYLGTVVEKASYYGSERDSIGLALTGEAHELF